MHLVLQHTSVLAAYIWSRYTGTAGLSPDRLGSICLLSMLRTSYETGGTNSGNTIGSPGKVAVRNACWGRWHKAEHYRAVSAQSAQSAPGT
jgi:hypothetical protein